MYNKKLAFVFPGVGSQYSGMCNSLYDNFTIFKDTIDEAGAILGVDMADLILNPEKAGDLSKLKNAQCSLVATGYATFRVFMSEIGIYPDFCLGHSLGEYSALCCAGFIDFESTLKLVVKRGQVISKASLKLDGTMVWVVNLEVGRVEQICTDMLEKGDEVYLSARDSSSQSAVSGSIDAIQKAAKILEAEGAIVYPLKLSGPFHSPMMKEAADELKEDINKITYTKGLFDVISNFTARPYPSQNEVATHLYEQLLHPINWHSSLEYLIEHDVINAIEMGPKNVLKFLIEQNTTKISPYSLNEEIHLTNLKNELTMATSQYSSLLGRCLGLVVGTRNYDPLSSTYEQDISIPYQEIKTAYENTINGEDFSLAQMKQSISSIVDILHNKKVPEGRIKQGITHLLDGKYLI